MPEALKMVTFNISWDEPESNGQPVQFYEISIRDEMSNKTLLYNSTVATFDMEKAHLYILNVFYKVKVRAYNEIGFGSYTKEEEFFIGHHYITSGRFLSNNIFVFDGVGNIKSQ